MSSREMFDLEPGDTGEAILPAVGKPARSAASGTQAYPEHGSASAEASKVNDKGAREYLTASDHEVRCALAWISGYDPELYERAMRRAKGDWS